MGCSSTRRKKGCNVLVPAFMYAQRIGPQLKFIKMTLLERTGVGRLLQIDCDDIYSKIGF